MALLKTSGTKVYKVVDPGTSTLHVNDVVDYVGVEITQSFEDLKLQRQADATVPTNLAITGDWTNEQVVSMAVDITGLAFTATMSDGSTKPVVPTSYTPITWSSTPGEQTVTFSYLENKVTVTATKIANVQSVKPASLTITGDWTNPQYVNTPVDYTGFTFTCTYNNSSTAVVAPTNLNPSTWSSTAGTQTCTFTYTENGVSVSASKDANVQKLVKYRVGGRIFYIHDDNGATYTFYDIDGNVLPTQTVVGLATAYEYVVLGAHDADKFYVYDSTNGFASNNIEWGAYDVSIGTSDGIGKGKNNAAKALSTSACFTPYTSGNTTIWKYLRDSINANSVGGCNDWFIGSNAEQDQLRSSGLVDWYSSNYIWSSVEYSSRSAYFWRCNRSKWSDDYKSIKGCVVPLRAF